MYKQPDVSSMAKTLTAALAEKGLKLTHSQAMELVAKLEGSRSLAALNAQRKEQKRKLKALAESHVAKQLFKSTGRYGASVASLMLALTQLYSSNKSRTEVQSELVRLMEGDNAPVLQEHIAQVYSMESLPSLYAVLLSQAESLISMTCLVQEVESAVVPGFQLIQDWRLTSGGDDDVPLDQQEVFELVLKQTDSGLSIDMAQAHLCPEDLDGKPQLSVIVEINQGVPCVHLTSELYGDSHVSVFGTAKGTIVRFNQQETPVASIMPPDGSTHFMVESARQL